MSEAIQIVTTLPARAAAEDLGRELVSRRLVACAQVGGPIASIYRWEGVIESAEEFTLTLKTRRELLDAVAAVIRELHSYDVPEIIAVEVAAGSEDYLKWLDENTRTS